MAQCKIDAALPHTETETRPSTAVAFTVLAAISFSHLLNDAIQSLLPAIYPLLKASFKLSFAEIGLIAFTLQLTASLLQPIVGYFSDRRPRPYALVGGMTSTLSGLLLLAYAPTLALVVVAAALLGVGSAVFHPESSRVARMASGGRHGFAQSFFQVGGNAGSSLGPLLAAFVVVPYGRASVAWCSIVAIVAIVVLWRIGGWYREVAPAHARAAVARPSEPVQALSRRRVIASLGILMTLIFSKYVYLASLTSYYTFYLISRFHVGVQAAQIDLFVFLASVAAGTFMGGPIGDRIGRKWVIWVSILGVLPFTLALPYANLFWTRALTVVIGLVLASAFSAILVYAQELVPHRVGLVAGIFFGFAFGVAGVGAAVLGQVADRTSIELVYRICSFLPAIGILTAFLPDTEAMRRRARARV
jgi:FSR family fosmidomycin resistance protein-like MFS transporter